VCARFINADVDFGDCRKSKELQDHKNMILLSGQSAIWISQTKKCVHGGCCSLASNWESSEWIIWFKCQFRGRRCLDVWRLKTWQFC